VDFLVNGLRVASDSTAPYSGAWSTNNAGTYIVSAQAIDGAGRTTTSAAATVTVAKRGRK
jgi:chitinase